MAASKKKGIRKFYLIDYEVVDGYVVVESGTLKESIEGEPLKDAVYEDIGPCDELTIGNTIYQMQKNGKLRKVEICGCSLDSDLLLIKREKVSQKGGR
ncbi:hypothetical protein DRH13_03565 [Candidatus Woesebacteria bacterium]|nr:MAG: hypothetical protein DRH13_03565 [Candidatus Woesebacteria bacterium]